MQPASPSLSLSQAVRCHASVPPSAYIIIFYFCKMAPFSLYILDLTLALYHLKCMSEADLTLNFNSDSWKRIWFGSISCIGRSARPFAAESVGLLVQTLWEMGCGQRREWEELINRENGLGTYNTTAIIFPYIYCLNASSCKSRFV